MDGRRLPELAQARQADYEVLRYQLQDVEFDEAWLDAQIDTLAQPIIAAIDCTACGNCCRVLDVYLEADDVPRLVQGGHIAPEQIGVWVEHPLAPEAEAWGKFRQKPCAFLRGNVCSVYAHRPDACRRYPQFTPDFRWVLEDIAQGAALCPIIYQVLEQVLGQVDDWVRRFAT